VRVLQDVDDLQPHVLVVLQIAQYLVGGIPLKQGEGMKPVNTR
jgi:hypothetical protein